MIPLHCPIGLASLFPSRTHTLLLQLSKTIAVLPVQTTPKHKPCPGNSGPDCIVNSSTDRHSLKDGSCLTEDRQMDCQGCDAAADSTAPQPQPMLQDTDSWTQLIEI